MYLFVYLFILSLFCLFFHWHFRGAPYCICLWIWLRNYDKESANVTTEVQYISTLWRRGRVIPFVIYLFLNSTLPIPDTKGISSSLAILANCLEQMSLSEYIPLAQMYGLRATHPLLQAYYCSYESALRSQYTALFYARHKVSQVMRTVLLLI